MSSGERRHTVYSSHRRSGWGIIELPLARIWRMDRSLTRRVAIFSIALGSALLAGCLANIPTPTELETVRTSSDAYLA